MIRLYILAFASLIFILPPMHLSADDRPDEYTIKAAILYKFVKYVEWPPSDARPREVTICIIGTDPFGARLDIIEKQSSADLSLKVKRNVSSGNIGQCQLAYIGVSEQDKISDILAKAQKYSVLTVSDISQSVDAGGIIEFVLTEDNKIKFVINLKAATAANLKMNPQLLEIAKSVIR